MRRCPNCRRPAEDGEAVCSFCDELLPQGNEPSRGQQSRPRGGGSGDTQSGAAHHLPSQQGQQPQPSQSGTARGQSSRRGPRGQPARQPQQPTGGRTSGFQPSKIVGGTGSILAGVAMFLDWITIEGVDSPQSSLVEGILASEGVTFPKEFDFFELTVLAEEPGGLAIGLFLLYVCGVAIGMSGILQRRVSAGQWAVAGLFILIPTGLFLIGAPNIEELEITVQNGTYLATAAGIAVLISGGFDVGR